MLNSFPSGSQALVQGASRGIGLEFVAPAARGAAVRAGLRQPAGAARAPANSRRSPPASRACGSWRSTSRTRTASRAPRPRSPPATDRLHLVSIAPACCTTRRRGIAPGEAPRRRPAGRTGRELRGQRASARCWSRSTSSALLAHRERAVFASISARVGSIGDNRLGGWYAYRGAKAAQNMFTKTLADRVGAVATQRHLRGAASRAPPTPICRDRSRRNVPPEKLFSPERTVRQLLGVIDGLTPADTGRFLAGTAARSRGDGRARRPPRALPILYRGRHAGRRSTSRPACWCTARRSTGTRRASRCSCCATSSAAACTRCTGSTRAPRARSPSRSTATRPRRWPRSSRTSGCSKTYLADRARLAGASPA